MLFPYGKGKPAYEMPEMSDRNPSTQIILENKSSFPYEQALIKLVYLTVEEAARKWTMRHRDWAMKYSS